MNRYRCAFGERRIIVTAADITEAKEYAAAYFRTWPLNISIEMIEEGVPPGMSGDI